MDERKAADARASFSTVVDAQNIGEVGVTAQVSVDEVNEAVAAVYEQGALRLLEPLGLPEHTRVQVLVRLSSLHSQLERRQVQRALLDAGLIRPRIPVESVFQVSEAQLVAASMALAAAGPLSDLIIAERDGL